MRGGHSRPQALGNTRLERRGRREPWRQRSGSPATRCVTRRRWHPNWRATGTLEDQAGSPACGRDRRHPDTRAVVRHLRSRGSMKAGCSRVPPWPILPSWWSGFGAAVDAGCRSGRRASAHRAAIWWNPKACSGLPWPRWTWGSRPTPRATSPARNPQPCAAGVDDLRTDRRNQTARRVSCPTAPATRPPPIISSRSRAKVLGAGIHYSDICFGNQILGRALGLSTYKMVFGHRGSTSRSSTTPRPIAVTARTTACAGREAGQSFDTPFGAAAVGQPHLRQRRGGGRRQTRRREGIFGAVPPGGGGGSTRCGYLFDQFVDLNGRPAMTPHCASARVRTATRRNRRTYARSRASRGRGR